MRALKFSPCATPRKNICMGERKAANRQFELLTQKTKSIAIQLQCTKCSVPAVTYIYIYVKHDTHLLASKKIFCTQICMKNYTALKLPSETLSGPTHNDMCFSIYLYYILTSRRPGTLAQRSVPKQKCQNLTSQT